MSIVIKSLIYSNIFVALCAASLAYQTELIWLQDEASIRSALLIFCATLSIYNYQRIWKYDQRPQPETTYSRWVLANRKRLLYMSHSAFLGFFVLAMTYGWQSWLLLGIIGVISVAYAIRLRRTNISFTPLRETAYIKVPIVAFIWAISTALLPLIEAGQLSFGTNTLILEVGARFLFVLGITMPFDIRDLELDRIQGLSTVPMRLGVFGTKFISLLAIALFVWVTSLALELGARPDKYGLMLTASACISGIFILYSGPKRKPIYYAFTLESMSLIQTLLVLAVS